jgi:hypothetical protein
VILFIALTVSKPSADLSSRFWFSPDVGQGAQGVEFGGADVTEGFGEVFETAACQN